MYSRDPSIRVPPHLVPTPQNGIAPALSFFKEDGYPTISLSATQITVDEQAFTYTGRTLTRLAAEINRALPAVTVASHLDVEPTASTLEAWVGDFTPEGGTIVRYKGVSAQLLESTRIRTMTPHPLPGTQSWFPRINRGSFRTTIRGGVYYFSVPEYISQAWSTKFGAPYMDVFDMPVTMIGVNTLRTPHHPLLHVPGITKIYRDNRLLASSIVEDIDEANGLIYLSRSLDMGDKVTVDYVYEESAFIYREVDLNPTLQHSPFLAEKFVVVYLVPTSSNTGITNSTAVRHVIGNSIEGAVTLLKRGLSTSVPVVLLGTYRTRQVEQAQDVSIFDSRRMGGGVKDDVDPIKRQKEAQFYTDIGTYDGDPFPGTSVVIATVPRTVLTTFSDAEVREIVQRHMALGTLPIVEYDS